MSKHMIVVNLLFLVCVPTFVKLEKDLLNMNPDEYALLEINSNNHFGYIGKAENFFLLIHNPWCKWSQKLNAKLHKINKVLKLEKQPFYLGSVDHTIEDLNFLMVYGIDTFHISYPTLISFKDGKFDEVFKARQTHYEVLTWIKKKIYSLKPYNLLSQDAFKYKLKEDRRAFLFYGPEGLELTKDSNGDFNEFHEESEDSKTSEGISESSNIRSLGYFNSYDKSSKNCTRVIFYYTTSKNLLDKYNPHRNYTLSVFSKGNLTQNYSEEITEDFLSDLCTKNTFRNFYLTFSQETIEAIFIRRTPAIIMFRNRYDNKTEYEELKMQTISWMHRDMVVVVTDIDGKFQLKLANYFGVTLEDLPAVRIVDFSGKNQTARKYSMSREITTENILNFLDKWKQGQLTNYFTVGKKDGTKQNSQSLVNRIKMFQFYEKVLLNRKNVLVLFYAEWCSKCKKHYSLLEVLSKRLNRELYSYVMIDVGESDNESISVTKVPAFYLYTSKNKEKPIVYEGELNANLILKFVKENVEMKVKQDL